MFLLEEPSCIKNKKVNNMQNNTYFLSRTAKSAIT